MTYVTGDGPPDIDATHAWAPVTGTAPPTLNVAGAGGAAPVLPWIKVRAIDGWRDFPETIDNRAGRTFGVGEIAYPARVLGKTVVYQCEVQAATRESARGTLSLAIAGFGLSMSDEGTMTVTPFTVPGGPAWTYTGRVIALDSDSTFTKLSGVWGPFRWGFTLSIRMSDPRFYTGGVGYF
jgi:hypothetical protein